MNISVLYEYAPLQLDGLRQPFGKLLKKQQDPGRPPSNKEMPQRSGNQNTAIADPRHRDYFNATPDGGSLESKTSVKPPAKRKDRPSRVPEFGQKIIPNTSPGDLYIG